MEDNDETADEGQRWAAAPETQRRAGIAKLNADKLHSDLLQQAAQSSDPMVRACSWAYREALAAYYTLLPRRAK